MRHYSTKMFFRNVSKDLLEKFFRSHEYLPDFDFNALNGNDKEALFHAWLNLPDEIKNQIDTIFQDIFDLSCEKGIKAINGTIESETNGVHSIRHKLAEIPNNYDRAFTVYLEHRLSYWDKILLFFHTDSLSNWRKRKQLPCTPVAKDQQSLKSFATAIGEYFYTIEAKGKNCIVETLRRGELDYYFAYPEDYSRLSNEWIDGEFTARPRKPALEIVFVYNQSEGFLDLNYRGATMSIPELQKLFVKHILNVDYDSVINISGVYDLNPLLQDDFKFTYSTNSGIQDVRIRSLRLSSKNNNKEKIILANEYRTDKHAVLNLYKKIMQPSFREEYTVTQAELTAEVQLDYTKRPKWYPFTITYPNYCTLKYDAEHARLRKMLEDSGIELRDPLVSSIN